MYELKFPLTGHMFCYAVFTLYSVSLFWMVNPKSLNSHIMWHKFCCFDFMKAALS